MRTIRVRERSTARLPPGLYRAVNDRPATEELLDAGIISLVRSRAVTHGIRAGAFVGQARLGPDLLLSVTEKQPGAFRSLLAWSLPDDLRTARTPSFVAPDSPVIEVFASRFLETLGCHLIGGRTKEYRRTSQLTSVVRGQIDMVGTSRSWTRGRFDHIACRRPALTADIPINRALALGVRAVDAYAAVTGGSEGLRVRARRFGAMFEDVDIFELMRGRDQTRRRVLETTLDDPRATGDLRDALMYARALVLHLGTWAEYAETQLPDAYFLNLETLFEDAVRSVTRATLGDHRVGEGQSLRRPLLVDREDVYLVDPDIVVATDDEVILTADCKYKDLEGGLPGHADVYQLTAHAHALGCSSAVLIYPGNRSSLNRLGTTRSDVDVWWITVNPASLEAHIVETFAALMGQLDD